MGKAPHLPLGYLLQIAKKMKKNKTLYIICVDDEKMVLDSLNAQLKRNLGNDYRYEFAQSGDEALEVIEELRDSDDEVIYVVISDWLMPGIKGDQLLRAIREKVNDVKTILLTGHMDAEVIQQIKTDKENKIKCIFKPWDEKALINLIKE